MWCHCGTMYNTLQNGTLGHNNVLPWFWEELLWHNHVQLKPNPLQFHMLDAFGSLHLPSLLPFDIRWARARPRGPGNGCRNW